MKKIMVSIITIILSLASFTVVALAKTTYSYKVPNQDFTKSYQKTYASGNVSFEYSPKSGALWWTTYASTRAGAFMSINGIGYVATTITTVDGSSKHTYLGISKAAGGWTYCEKATVKGQEYAKRASYYADFRSSSNVIDKVYALEVN